MISFEKLTELGAQLVAGRVIYQGAFVEGILEADAFIPAPGSALDLPADEPKVVSRRRVVKPVSEGGEDA